MSVTIFTAFVDTLSLAHAGENVQGGKAVLKTAARRVTAPLLRATPLSTK